MIPEYSKFQKYAIKWLAFFSIFCFVNSIVVIKFHFLDNVGYFLAFILPFAHCAVIFVTYILYNWYGCFMAFFRNDAHYLIGKDEQYIKSYHPIIWKKLHPWGDYSHNSFTFSRFIKGNYDDGTDDKLSQIKFKYKVNTNLMLWPFFLVLVIWFFNLLLISLSGWQWQAYAIRESYHFLS